MVPQRVQAGEQLAGWVDVLKHLQHRAGGWKQPDDAGQERFFRAVDEGEAVLGLRHQEQTVVDHLTRRIVAVA